MSGLNETPSGERVRIVFFGRRNAGKSSLVNAFTGQNLSVVSPVGGTTTDPVQKAMELLPLGPVLVVDTPGLDDTGELGQLRVARARQALGAADVGILVLEAGGAMDADEKALTETLARRGVPCLIARTKADLLDEVPPAGENEIFVSAKTGFQINALKNRAAALSRGQENTRPLVSDLVGAGDGLTLVVPIDGSAPRGRLILPQQQVIRDGLEAGAVISVCQPEGLPQALAAMKQPPRLVVTDSQAFGKVQKIVPPSVPLTSFSILMARYKGDLAQETAGAAALRGLQTGDPVLIAEGCTHHRQCEDIGTVKIPGWIRGYTGAEPAFSFVSGGEFPDRLTDYRLIVHCGGCMLGAGEMARRLRAAAAQGVPVVNYGVAIAEMHGILARAIAPFPEYGVK